MTRPQCTGLATLLALFCACQPPTTDVPVVASEPADVGATGPHVRVLGTVQDGGLPHASCRCDRCRAARDLPDRARHVASLAIELPESGRVFLIDATPDIRAQLEELRDPTDTDGTDRSPVDGVFLTHAHLGHYTGLVFFGYEAVHTHNLPVYCTQKMAKFLRTNQPWRQLVEIENITLIELTPEQPFTLGDGVTATPIVVPHRDELSDTVGYIIRGPSTSLLYVPDTDRWDTWNPTIEARIAEVDTALLDGTFFSADELPGRAPSSIGHPLIIDSMTRLRHLSDQTRILFTHLNHSNPALTPNAEPSTRIKNNGFAVLQETDRFDL